MIALDGVSQGVLFVLFGLCALIIALVGVSMAECADRLADKTGLGEAIVGGLFLGASTSLSGIVTSVAAAYGGHPQLAVSNALGGIAAQTAFLAIADIAYRRANLEHAAASAVNLTQAVLLICLLSITIVAFAGPNVSFLGVHPATPVLAVVYVFGLRLASLARRQPMWHPQATRETKEDRPDASAERGTSLFGLLVKFSALAAIIGTAGYAIARIGVQIAESTGLSETFVGALMTAVATSLPELVTTVAAVRRGAVTLALGGIIGGNTFDVLFLVMTDIAYRPGSIYHTMERSDAFWVGIAILMTGALLLGMLRREKQGVGGIGFESAAILGIYVFGVVVAFALG